MQDINWTYDPNYKKTLICFFCKELLSAGGVENKSMWPVREFIFNGEAQYSCCNCYETIKNEEAKSK
jgi:hypothetical protein